MPDFDGKRLLDLGCGYGWHCIYAMEHGAASAIGIDISEKMHDRAAEKTKFPQVQYMRMATEDMDFPDGSFDVVLSSLALHYVDNYFYEGVRRAVFLGEEAVKYHKTLTTYLGGLLTNGFALLHVVEPQPPEHCFRLGRRECCRATGVPITQTVLA